MRKACAEEIGPLCLPELKTHGYEKRQDRVTEKTSEKI